MAVQYQAAPEQGSLNGEKECYEMILTRRGREVGRFEYGDKDQTRSEREESGFYVASLIDGRPVASLVFRVVGECIELSNPIRWLAKRPGEVRDPFRELSDPRGLLLEVAGEAHRLGQDDRQNRSASCCR